MYLQAILKTLIQPSKQFTCRIAPQTQASIKKDHPLPFSDIQVLDQNEVQNEERLHQVESFADQLRNKKFKQIAFLTGAGISVSAGIPDFRSPETGLYAQIKKEYNLNDPQKIFSIRYYQENPLPFISVIRDFFSREYEPTYAHKLINLVNKKKQLLINITQNIDGLELKEGVVPSKVVQAHGHMRSAHCVKCNHQMQIDTFIDNCRQSKVTHCPKCQHFVKPKIVFFGEFLPQEFHASREKLDKTDCVVVMGTSLGVFPFANLITGLKPSVPIYIINNQLPKNLNHVSNSITFIQGDINAISKQILDKLQ